jgi:hypothetical protein
VAVVFRWAVAEIQYSLASETGMASSASFVSHDSDLGNEWIGMLHEPSLVIFGVLKVFTPFQRLKN